MSNGNSSQRVGLRLEPKWLRTLLLSLSLSLLLSLTLRRTFTHPMGRSQCRQRQLNMSTAQRDNASGVTIRTLATQPYRGLKNSKHLCTIERSPRGLLACRRRPPSSSFPKPPNSQPDHTYRWQQARPTRGYRICSVLFDHIRRVDHVELGGSVLPSKKSGLPTRRQDAGTRSPSTTHTSSFLLYFATSSMVQPSIEKSCSSSSPSPPSPSVPMTGSRAYFQRHLEGGSGRTPRRES